MDPIGSTRPTRRTRRWGRRIIIDTPERLNEIIGLMQAGLPTDMRVGVHRHRDSMPCQGTNCEMEERVPIMKPVPFVPDSTTTERLCTPKPSIMEVQVSIIANDSLGWLLPVHFCIGELLTAHEVVTKIADAFRILRTWSDSRKQEELAWAELITTPTSAIQ